MNKRIFIFAIGIFFAFATFAQKSFDDLYRSFSSETNVEKVNMNGLVMTLAKPFIKTETGGSISGISVLSLDECSQAVKNKFNEQALKTKDKDYELFVSSNEKNEKVRIFVKLEKELIREMVILTTGDEPSMVRLKGKIKPSEIEKIANGK